MSEITIDAITIVSDDLVFSANKVIRRNTSDGSDNGSVSLTGGGATGTSRGGELFVYGNEHGTPGSVLVAIGNVASSQFAINRADGTESFRLLGSDSSAAFTSNTNNRAWTFNSTHADGGALGIQRSGTEKVAIGIAQSVASSISTSVDDGMVRAQATSASLYIEGGSGGQVRSTTIYNDTTSGNGNVAVDSTGRLRRTTSSARYKTNIEGLSDWHFLLELEPVTFNSISAPNGRRYGGLLAENVATVNPTFAVFNDRGEPDDVAYGHLTAPIIKAIQDLTAGLKTAYSTIDELTKTVNDLKTANHRL